MLLLNILNSVINYIHSRSGAGAGASHFKSVEADPEPIIFKMSERSWSRSFLELLEPELLVFLQAPQPWLQEGFSILPILER